MSERGIYGTARIGAAHDGGGSSLGTWIVGGLVVGGAVLWARHQSMQIEQLYKVEGLPHQSFIESMRERSRELSTTARDRLHELSQRFRTKKEA